MGPLDRALLRGSALASMGLLAARALGFATHLVLARGFLPAEYGEIRYAILLGELCAAGTQPFGQHVLARLIGAQRSASESLEEHLASAWAILALALAASLLLSAPALAAVGYLRVEVILILLGLTVYYVYWGLARGYQAAGRLALAVAGGNGLQLVVVLMLVEVLQVRSPRLVLAIYGGSYLLPVLLLQALAPLPIRIRAGLVRRAAAVEILGLALPVWGSHAAYLLYAGLDVLLLKQFTNLETVGAYALAKTVSGALLLPAAGIGTALMPRTAGLPASRQGRLLLEAGGLALAAQAGMAAAYAAGGSRVMGGLFEAGYQAGPGVLAALAAGMALYGLYSLACAALIGRGLAGVELGSRLAALGAAGLAGWLLVPVYGGLGAALSCAAGAAGGLAAWPALERMRRRRI